jgi:hypothetical protein
VFALAREAQSNVVANPLPLLVRLADRAIALLSLCPVCVLTPLVLRRAAPSLTTARRACHPYHTLVLVG